MPKAAGCLFTNGKQVLAGLQEKDGKMIISGLGGCIEPSDECEIDAAIREVLEELFHLENVSHEIVRYLMVHYIPRNHFQNGDYSVFVYDFHDLNDFLHICQGFGLVSPLYECFPTKIDDLLLRRKILPEAEIKQLLLLPLMENLEVCPYFQSDLTYLRTKM